MQGPGAAPGCPWRPLPCPLALSPQVETPFSPLSPGALLRKLGEASYLAISPRIGQG